MRVGALTMLVAFTVWVGYGYHHLGEVAQRNAAMVQAARDGMVTLTTVGYHGVEQDVQSILDSSTEGFRDDFAKNSASFIETAKTSQAVSVGTVTEAGLESADGDRGRVLVALTVMTSNHAVPERQPQNWRTRVTVSDTDGRFKVASVEFIR